MLHSTAPTIVRHLPAYLIAGKRIRMHKWLVHAAGSYVIMLGICQLREIIVGSRNHESIGAGVQLLEARESPSARLQIGWRRIVIDLVR